MLMRYCAIFLLALFAVASCSNHSDDRDYRPLGDPQAEKRSA